MSIKTTLGITLITAVIAFTTGAFLFITDDYSETGLPISCNVLVVSMDGYLSTYSNSDEEDVTSSDDILDAILLAKAEDQIKAVVLSIDSYGGDGVAGEEVANALVSLEKPTVAAIRSIGVSSAYWAATGADRIFASRISDVGGIGITASYLDESIKNTRDGYTFIELNSARFKDVGNPSRLLTNEEKNLILSDLEKIHNIFVDDIATNRNLDRDTVARLANGLTFIGVDALENGLIDEIGDLNSASNYLKNQIAEDVELCWY